MKIIFKSVYLCEMDRFFYRVLVNMEIDIDSDSSTECTLPREIDAALENSLKLLPAISRRRYQVSYNQFMIWRESKHASSFSEHVFLTYFKELSEKRKPTSLWVQYSMLRTTLGIYHGVDIAQYLELRAMLKRKEVNRFLHEAPDYKYLFAKVNSK